MESIYDHRTSKVMESVVKFIFDDYNLPKTDEYYNNETNICVADVLRFVFKDSKPPISKETKSKCPVSPISKEIKSQEDKLADLVENKLVIDRRPTFYTKSGQPIRAAGILCFVINPSTKKKIWLLRESKGYLTDTGGKTDIEDESAMETAIRETVEETNGHLFSYNHSEERCFQIISKYLPRQKNKNIYIKDSKYMLFTFELRYPIFFKSLKRFGTIEKTDNEPHLYRWYHKIPYERLHPRLSKIKNRIK